MLTVNGKTANYQPNRPFEINGKPSRLVSPVVNGIVPYHININGLDRPGVLPGCVFYGPLWHPALGGTTFRSLDKNSHLCTVTGATWGIQGRAFITDNKIDCGASAALDLSTYASLFAWVKVNTTTGASDFRTVAGKHTVYSYYIYQDQSGGGYYFNIKTATGNVGGIIGTEALNTWKFVGFTFDSTLGSNNIKPYYNAVLGTPATRAEALSSTVNTFNIGGSPSRFLDGTVGEVFVFNRVLTAQEVMQLYLSTKWRYV